MMFKYIVYFGSQKLGVYNTSELVKLAKCGVKMARKNKFETVIKVSDITNLDRAIEYLSNDIINYKIKKISLK